MEEEGLLCTPPEIRELAEATAQSLLPEKSETAYKKQFQKFEDWRQENNIQTVSENVLLATLKYSAKNTNHQRFGQFTQCCELV
jgi:beta-lactamase class D